MSNEYTRMRALLEPLGIAFEENGISAAEVAAYAAGMALVREDMENSARTVFPVGEDSSYLSKYAELFHIDTAGRSGEEIRSRLTERMAQPYGDYTVTGFDRAFADVGSGSYEMEEFEGIIFSGVKAEDLKRLGEFIHAYVFINTESACDGSGLTFDEWDAWAQRFYDYDSLQLAWNIIDTLRSDMFE